MALFILVSWEDDKRIARIYAKDGINANRQ